MNRRLRRTETKRGRRQADEVERIKAVRSSSWETKIIGYRGLENDD